MKEITQICNIGNVILIHGYLHCDNCLRSGDCIQYAGGRGSITLCVKCASKVQRGLIDYLEHCITKQRDHDA